MPAIIKPSRIATMIAVEPAEAGGLMTVSAFVLFDFENPRSFLTEQALWPMVTEQLPKGAVFDKGQLKPKGEWIVAGAAMAPGDHPVGGVQVVARVGATEKRLSVFGDRFWRLTDRGLEMTEAVPFLSMPVDEIRAFGGPDYKANPRGRGHQARKILDAGHDAPLPNVEYAVQTVRSPDDNPYPAHFGPIAPDAPQRLRYAGTYDQHWLRNRAPLKPADFNPLMHCDAPEDQRLGGHFAGDEPFSVSGMTRGGSAHGRLPNVRMRGFVHRPDDGSFTEIRMVCDTLTLFPNVTKATIAFRGLVSGNVQLCSDIGTVMLALEHAEDEPRSVAYYLHIFGLRKDTAEAHKHALSDFQLMPEIDKVATGARRAAKLERARQDRILFTDNQNWAARKVMADLGMSPDLVPPPNYSTIDDLPLVAQPTADEALRGDIDLAELLDDVKTLELAINDLNDREMARAELHRRAMAASVPAGLLPAMALRPLVDDAHMQRHADLALDDDITAAFATLEAQLSSPALSGEALPAGYGAVSEQVDAAFRVFAGAAVDPEAMEKQYQSAVARALGRPEGSIFHDAHQALQQFDPAGMGMPESRVDDDADGRRFTALFGELAAMRLDGPMASATPLSAFPEGGIGADTAATKTAMTEAASVMKQNFPHLAGDLRAEGMFPALQARLADMVPRSPIREGATLGEVMQETKDNLEQKLDTAEEEYDAAVRDARLLSPMAIFPMEPMLAEPAERFGHFIRERLHAGHDFRGADLSGANLRGADFGDLDLRGTFFEQADLTGADFSGANLEGAVFTQAILDGANLAGANLARPNLNKASFRGTVFDGCTITGITILEADFSGATLRNATLASITLIDCILDGADLSGATISDLQWLKGRADRLKADKAQIARAAIMTLSLSGASFAGSVLDRVAFVEVEAAGADFAGARMNSVSFAGKCNLKSGRFEGLQARDSSWNTTDLDQSCFFRSDCEACLFNDCDVNDADLRLASFKNSRFQNSRMRESDLFGANLFAASLASTDLTLASLRGANLYAVDLMDATLASVDLTGSNFSKTVLERTYG